MCIYPECSRKSVYDFKMVVSCKAVRQTRTRIYFWIGDKKGRPRGKACTRVARRNRHHIMAHVGHGAGRHSQRQPVLKCNGPRARARDRGAVKSTIKHQTFHPLFCLSASCRFWFSHGFATDIRRRKSLGQRPLIIARRPPTAAAPAHAFRELPVTRIQLPHFDHRNRRHRLTNRSRIKQWPRWCCRRQLPSGLSHLQRGHGHPLTTQSPSR